MCRDLTALLQLRTYALERPRPASRRVITGDWWKGGRPKCLRVRQDSHSLDRRAGGVLREPHTKLSSNNDATIGGVMSIATARQVFDGLTTLWPCPQSSKEHKPATQRR